MKIKGISNPFSYQPTCSGIGLVALDVVLKDDQTVSPLLFTGGTCGNVMGILSYLGWKSFPIARLADNQATKVIIEDLSRFNVDNRLITVSRDGSTPIIIQRLLRDKLGKPKHRFEFRDPTTGKYLPGFKGVLSNTVSTILDQVSTVKVFFIDRINRASIELAKKYKEGGALIFLEPSNISDTKLFAECLRYTDILKFSAERVPDYKNLYATCQVPVEIETVGEQGARFRTKQQPEWKLLKPFAQENILDAAGAGDWCTAGIIHYLFVDYQKEVKHCLDSYEEIADAINFGQLLGSINCLFIGARGLMYEINRELLFKLLAPVADSGDFTILNSFVKRPSLVVSHSEKESSFKLLLPQLY